MKTLSLRFAAASILLTVAMAAIAQEGDLGEAPTRAILKSQEKADAYFAKGKFDKAMSIYRDDLAPLGDKYSQYMVGYMYLAGKGVQEDAIVASAWVRLAAQRETEQYARIRDSLLALFNDEQRLRSDQLYVELRKDMGDMALVNKLIQDDMKILRLRNVPRLILEAEFERGARRYKRSDFDAAASRIVSRISYMERQMALEKTLDDAELETLTTLVHEAETEVEAYRASR